MRCILSFCANKRVHDDNVSTIWKLTKLLRDKCMRVSAVDKLLVVELTFRMVYNPSKEDHNLTISRDCDLI